MPWVRDLAGPGARLLALGDDVTDEHMFRVLDAVDDAVVVRTSERRRTAARWELDDSTDVRSVLQWIAGVRSGETPVPTLLPRAIDRPPPSTAATSTRDLLVVSNRLPELRPDARAEHVMVVDQDDPPPHGLLLGSVNSISVPSPGTLVTEAVPPARSIRPTI